MISIDKIYESEYIINKSKFLSFAYPVFTEDECKDYLNDLRKKYADATHICFSYILSNPKVEKCSDDGEPSGTAGKPILELIKKRKLENILIVVIRYFGGIKLGAGGLVRAYTNSANLSIDNASVIEFRDVDKYMVEISYDDLNKVKNLINSKNGIIKDIEYSESLKVYFLSDDISNLIGYKVEKIGSEMICS